MIGKGAFGKVYLTKCTEIADRAFATKVIRKDMLAEKQHVVESILIECQVLFEANHPFIVNMEYFFETDSHLYFVMPLVEGGSLKRLM